jgi:hypothetical protein
VAEVSVPGREPGLHEQRLLSMRDIVDGQLETVDDRRIGRVADLAGEWRADGILVLTDIVVGPEALARRVSGWLGILAWHLFRGRHEHRIPMSDVEEVGPTVRLRGKRADYPLTGADDWIVQHIIRFIPGGGAEPGKGSP